VHAGPPFPARQITIVVPFAAGGPSDAMARLIAQGLGEKVGARVIVENMPGAGGTIGSARVSRADPDGHTLVFGNIGTHAANVGLYKALPYSPETDFEPVALIANVPFVVAGKRALAVDDFAAFRALAAAKPGTLTYGSAGIGSASHLAGLLLDAAMGAKAQHVPYRGVAPAMNDLVAGQIDFMCDQTVTMIPQIKGAIVKPLAVMSRARVAQLPELPTVAETGLAGAEVEAWNALFAPKGTPRDLVEQLFAATWGALEIPAIRARFEELGAVIPSKDAAGPQALRAHVAAEVRKWVPVIRSAGISAE
jgi:tripartite-type tricarboxylate transporter receptor subunit TctC